MKKIFYILLPALFAFVPKEPTQRIEFEAPDSYPEGVVFDKTANVYYVSSARTATIGKVAGPGSYAPLFTDSSLKSSYGLKIHPDGKRLFACISDANYSKFTSPDTRKKLARLISIDTKTGKKLSDVDLSKLIPGKHFINDLTFDPKGNAYVTDSFANAIYKVTPDGKASVFSKSDLFKTEGVGLNGIVWHTDGFLLVDSSGSGMLYKVDGKDGSKVTKVKTEQFFMNADGLLLNADKTLTLVQNGGVNKIYKLESKDNWASAKIKEATMAEDRFTYPSTATVNAKNETWIMNAKFNELIDSTLVPSKKFAIQKAVFVPIP